VALMRFTDDVIDVYGVRESEVVAARRDPDAFPAFHDLLKCVGDQPALIGAVEALLAASISQRTCSASGYAAAKAIESEAAGAVLSAIIQPGVPPHARVRGRAFVLRLSKASNLWDALWDLREDGRRTLPVAFAVLSAFLRATLDLLFSGSCRQRCLRELR